MDARTMAGMAQLQARVNELTAEKMLLISQCESMRAQIVKADEERRMLLDHMTVVRAYADEFRDVLKVIANGCESPASVALVALTPSPGRRAVVAALGS